MNIIACIKQVPNVLDMRIDPVTHTLIREGVPSIVNPYDEPAVEEAVRIKEKLGGSVTVITMGPPQAKKALDQCLAMGADEAILLTDRVFAGADSYATAYTLSRAIRKYEPKFDLILCGKQAIDGDTAQVGPGLAEQLGVPQVTGITELEVEDGKARVHRVTDFGYEIIECRLPALFGTEKGMNEPRVPSTLRRLKAEIMGKTTTVGYAQLGGSPDDYGLKGSFTKVVKVFTPEVRSKGLILSGEDYKEAARRIVDLLLAQGVTSHK